jgi:hypothetical protein
MQQCLEAGGRLDRMAERVPKVQRDTAGRARAFTLVGEHHVHLGHRAPLDELGDVAPLDRARVTAGDGVAARLQQLEEPLVAEDRHLHGFPERRPSMPCREGGEERHIDHDVGRLVEGTDQVLPLGQVDRRLAADGRIDLGDEGRRDVHDRDAAQVCRGEEAGGVSERAAADRDDRLAPRDVVLGEVAGGRFDDGKPLGRLALGQEDRLDRPTPLLERRRDPGAHRIPRAGLGHDDGPSSLETAERLVDGRGGDPITDHDPADRRLCGQQRRAPIGVAASFGDVRLDRADDRRHVGDTGDMDVRRRVIPLPAGGKVPQRPDRIASGHEGPDVGRPTQSLGQDLWSPVEPDDEPAPIERPSIARINHRPTARCDDPADEPVRIGRAELFDSPALQPAEGWLAVLGEDRRDRASVVSLDPFIEVDERRRVAMGEPLADDALAAPGQADEDDVHLRWPSRRRRSRPRRTRSARVLRRPGHRPGPHRRSVHPSARRHARYRRRGWPWRRRSCRHRPSRERTAPASA